jgi:acetyl-CoA C-acetyltransferase
MDVNIIGTAHTKFGRDPRTIGDLMCDVYTHAINAADNVDGKSIDAIYISNFSSSFAKQCHLSAVLGSYVNGGGEITRVESACASGGVAIKEAYLAIRSGLYTTVLVVGVEKMRDVFVEESTSIIARAASKKEMYYGATFPSLYALMARRHFHEFGTNEEDLAQIAVKNHRNAFYNPNAQFQKLVTVDDVLQSKMIASPLKLLDCAPITDGAAAVLLSNNNHHNFCDEPIQITAIGHHTDGIDLFKRQRLTSMPSVVMAAKKAYLKSGLLPKDIDVAEVHDCFTIAELILLEDLGFCVRGDGKELIERGATEIDGTIPVNPSGGLKAKGHPIGATGVGQIVEITNQLLGQSGKRQVTGAENGLCCNVGGTGGSAVVTVLSR